MNRKKTKAVKPEPEPEIDEIYTLPVDTSASLNPRGASLPRVPASSKGANLVSNPTSPRPSPDRSSLALPLHPRSSARRAPSGGTNLLNAAKSAASQAVTPQNASATKLAPVRLRMEGEFWFLHSLAGVNRETGVRLARRPGIEVSFAPTGGRQFGPEVDHRLTIIDERTFANLSGPAHIHLRHFYPPRLNPPIEGLLVVILAWEYGFLPIRWIPEMLANVAEFWCYSEAIRQTYIASGIPSERLFVIPLGADSSVFRPDGPKHIFTDEPGSHRLASLDEEPFIFLFCGGVQARKSADLIEQAMLRTFAPGEPVVCVIKDFCSRTVYRGGNGGERFRALAMDDSRPVFIYMDEDLTPMQLPR